MSIDNGGTPPTGDQPPADDAAPQNPTSAEGDDFDVEQEAYAAYQEVRALLSAVLAGPSKIEESAELIRAVVTDDRRLSRTLCALAIYASDQFTVNGVFDSERARDGIGVMTFTYPEVREPLHQTLAAAADPDESKVNEQVAAIADCWEGLPDGKARLNYFTSLLCLAGTRHLTPLIASALLREIRARNN